MLVSTKPKSKLKGVTAMIRVREISHASHETPDIDKQAEYYTNVLGLTLVAKERDAIYLERQPWTSSKSPTVTTL
jgi:catechol-2,3-dioxygenase